MLFSATKVAPFGLGWYKDDPFGGQNPADQYLTD